MSEQHTDNLSPLQGEALRSYISDSYQALEKESVLYQWRVNIKQGHAIFSVFLVLVFFGGGGTWYLSSQGMALSSAHLGLLIFTFFGMAISRYLFTPNQLYHYHITAKGIFYTQQDNIPDIAFTIARGLGWFGCGVCVLAAGMLGPAAFIGAGASALLAWKIKDMQPVEKKNVCLFVKNEKKMTIRLFERKSAIKFIVSPLSPYTYAFIYCKEGESGKVMQLLSPYIAAYDVIKVNSWREF
ncbi:hypothetical protein [Aeromonas sp. BIGb0445]|uniref:hypothetical protein n=1 Tax=Aeromonas sp. BIGb0445 TaxID=2940593 RepID=UPI0021673B38|nr:hypothetical protein [Aeromonas sp. BIGb0445]MCS3458913.1 hypothetical protein [Aeromonas sp. BIGb0445]